MGDILAEEGLALGIGVQELWQVVVGAVVMVIWPTIIMVEQL